MTTQKPLRLWPGVVIAIVQLLVMIGAPLLAPDDGALIGMLGGVVGALLIALWWLLFSRAPWSERVGAIVLMVVAVFATRSVAHTSMVGAGQGMMLFFLPTPYLALALVIWAAAARHLHDGVRRAVLVAAILIACAPFALIRTAGIRGGAGGEFHWRWTPTPEQLLLARGGEEPKPLPTAAAAATSAAPAAEMPKETTPATPEDKKIAPTAPAAVDTPAEWPGFRGPLRDGVVRGVRIETDWTKSPPVAIWRRPIGPGWSSFAVNGDLLYTQEQRGDDEVVACYRVSTGKPVWRHSDHVRFWESNGGAGPRGTPTLSNGRVYAFGATGILNALDAGTGRVIWSRMRRPTRAGRSRSGASRVRRWWWTTSWSSPCPARLAAPTSRPASRAGPVRSGGSYSSPQLVTIDGVPQILILSAPGAVSVSPADGKLLWEHTWEGGAIVQPALTADGGILINAMSAMGGIATRRLAVARGTGGWTVEERWTSNGLKPYYSDFVVHKGHAYGFDGSILACIDLEDGKRKWKGGRFGTGQLVLLADQDVLLVTSEDGELALVRATPDQFTELARIPALNAKTWNHPVLVGDRLLVRNGEEMVAFRLSLASPASLSER